MRWAPVLRAEQSRPATIGGPPPLVLLFGWLGSKERYLNKYCSVWQSLGGDPVVSRRPTILQTALPSLADAAAVATAQHVGEAFDRRCQADGMAPPVIMQCMSGAGFIAAGTLLHLTSLLSSQGVSSSSSSSSSSRWQAHPLLRDAQARSALAAIPHVLANTRGIVIDSAPPLFTPAIWTRGFVSALMSVEAHGLEERYPLTVRAARALTERYFQMSSVYKRMVEVRKAWVSAAPLCPQLYLYSRVDPLIPYQHVELFMEQQEARGVEVHSHCWADSGHCDHLRVHPQQYRQLVLSFAEHVCHSDENTAEAWI